MAGSQKWTPKGRMNALHHITAQQRAVLHPLAVRDARDLALANAPNVLDNSSLACCCAAWQAATKQGQCPIAGPPSAGQRLCSWL